MRNSISDERNGKWRGDFCHRRVDTREGENSSILRDYLMADEFCAELKEGMAYVAGHDDQLRLVVVIYIYIYIYIYISSLEKKRVHLNYCSFELIYTDVTLSSVCGILIV